MQKKYMSWMRSKNPQVEKEMSEASMPEQVLRKYAYGGDVQDSDIDKIKDNDWFQNPEEMDQDDMSSYDPDSDVPGMGDDDEQPMPRFAEGGEVMRRGSPQSSPSMKRDSRGIGGAHDEYGDDHGVPVGGNEQNFAKALKMRKIRGNRG